MWEDVPKHDVLLVHRSRSFFFSMIHSFLKRNTLYVINKKILNFYVIIYINPRYTFILRILDFVKERLFFLGSSKIETFTTNFVANI